MRDNYVTLEELLKTQEGCAHVTAELLVALEKLDMITPDMMSMPTPLLERSDIVMHIVKSRETKDGWIAVKFPVEGR